MISVAAGQSLSRASSEPAPARPAPARVAARSLPSPALENPAERGSFSLLKSWASAGDLSSSWTVLFWEAADAAVQGTLLDARRHPLCPDWLHRARKIGSKVTQEVSTKNFSLA